MKSPASPIEMGLLDAIARRGIKLTAFCSSLGEIHGKSSEYDTIIIEEKKYWLPLSKIIKRIFPDLINIPDFHVFSWNNKAIKSIERLLDVDGFDYIHSFSHSNSCHLVANKIHKESGLPWIATFFDSWTDYPELDYKMSYFERLNKDLERQVAENATIIVHNNDNIANLWGKRYGENVARKIIVIPLNERFYNPPVSLLEIEKKDVVTISHIGTFYPFRDASSFIEGVRLFTEKYPEYRSKVQINFIGNSLESDKRKILDYKLNDIFNLLGRISKEECEKYYLNSDIFLATAKAPFEDYTYPSKILKYFFYDKPILGICPKTSVLHLELLKAGHSQFCPDDIEGIADYIMGAIENYESICSYNRDYWKCFSEDVIADKYCSVIRNMINKKE